MIDYKDNVELKKVSSPLAKVCIYEGSCISQRRLGRLCDENS